MASSNQCDFHFGEGPNISTTDCRITNADSIHPRNHPIFNRPQINQSISQVQYHIQKGKALTHLIPDNLVYHQASQSRKYQVSDFKINSQNNQAIQYFSQTEQFQPRSESIQHYISSINKGHQSLELSRAQLKQNQKSQNVQEEMMNEGRKNHQINLFKHKIKTAEKSRVEEEASMTTIKKYYPTLQSIEMAQDAFHLQNTNEQCLSANINDSLVKSFAMQDRNSFELNESPSQPVQHTRVRIFQPAPDNTPFASQNKMPVSKKVTISTQNKLYFSNKRCPPKHNCLKNEVIGPTKHMASKRPHKSDIAAIFSFIKKAQKSKSKSKSKSKDYESFANSHEKIGNSRCQKQGSAENKGHENNSSVTFEVQKLLQYRLIQKHMKISELEELVAGYLHSKIEAKRWILLVVDEVYRKLKNRYRSEYP